MIHINKRRIADILHSNIVDCSVHCTIVQQKRSCQPLHFTTTPISQSRNSKHTETRDNIMLVDMPLVQVFMQMTFVTFSYQTFFFTDSKLT